jgi:hypothetical protein
MKLLSPHRPTGIQHCGVLPAVRCERTRRPFSPRLGDAQPSDAWDPSIVEAHRQSLPNANVSDDFEMRYSARGGRKPWSRSAARHDTNVKKLDITVCGVKITRGIVVVRSGWRSRSPKTRSRRTEAISRRSHRTRPMRSGGRSPPSSHRTTRLRPRGSSPRRSEAPESANGRRSASPSWRGERRSQSFSPARWPAVVRHQRSFGG